MRLSHPLTLVGLLCGVLVTSPRLLNAKRLNGMRHLELSGRGPSTKGEERTTDTGAAPPRVQNFTFSNPKASRTYARLGELASLRLTRFQSST